MKIIKIFLFLGTVVFATNNAQAAVKLSQLESYLNNLKTLQAHFKQWDPNGTLTTGTLYLKRPGQIRMNYNSPSKLVILADGETLFFADRATGDLSYSPIHQSPAAFFLEANINFQQKFKVEEFSVDGDRVKLTIRRKGDNDIGALSLVFQRSPTLKLIQWIIIDPQDKKTIINLEGIQSGHRINPVLFDSSILLK